MSEHSLPAIVARARKERGENRPVVLATVVATAGSTYRKAGARMLIGRSGVLAGVVGGGCFDADLVERADACLAMGSPQTHMYDMRSPDEAIWGLGLGCEGAATVLFQPLATPDDDWLLTLLEDIIVTGGWLSTDIEMDDSDCAGSTVKLVDSPDKTGVRSIAGRKTFVERVIPAPRLEICGAGVDAVPVARFARALSWNVTVVDHRPDYLQAHRFPDAVPLVPKAQWQAKTIDAAVIMSHHLPSDADYLRSLVATDTPYIGLLGPSARRERLLAECSVADGDRSRVRGPAGLDLGGELPEEVALSILAEINAVHFGGNAEPWTGQSRK